MTDLRVRIYNVLFGDAILVTKMAKGANRKHILFDVGNILSGEGGKDDVFKPIFADIQKETGGHVDLYVMTHEHLDHVQGLFYAHSKLNTSITADHVWITGSAEPGYYTSHPDAAKKKKSLSDAYDRALPVMEVRSAQYARFAAMAANNNPRDTEQCVDHLRTKVGQKKSQVHYVYRGLDVSKKHGFTGATFEILAPEEDTSDYYGRSKPFAVGAVGDRVGGGSGGPTQSIIPPAGVDAGAFSDLLRSREEGFLSSLLQIDRAANNTSVVIEMTFDGRRLLFPGDAEIKSWRFMAKQGTLQPVDFLKLGHHGSHNGMPLEYLDDLLPKGSKKRDVGLSTCNDCYSGVPYDTLVDELKTRARIHDTRKVKAGGYVDVII